MNRGYLFVFEGPDNVGKTTIVHEVNARLVARGLPSVSFSFPGKQNGTLGKLIYDVHHNPNSFGVSSIDPQSLQLLHIAAHIDSIQNQIVPILLQRKLVLLDRYWWSTYAYGIVNGVAENALKGMIELEKITWNNIKPDTVFLIKRGEADTNERKNLCNQYDLLSTKEGQSYKVSIVNNNVALAETISEIISNITSLIEVGE